MTLPHSSGFSFSEESTNWNSDKKTKAQKEVMRYRGNLLNSRMNYSLDIKLKMAKSRLREAIKRYGQDSSYLSFSGGRDSTVLSHIVTSMGYKLDHVLSNTRLEYPECIDFAKKWCDKRRVKLHIVTPKELPNEIWEKHGYPMFSKEVAEILERVRNGRHVSEKKLNRINGYMQYKDLPISAKCCHYLKKKPLKEWQRSSGKNVAIMGIRAEESQARRTLWVRKGCIYTTHEKQVVVNPIMFFTDKDLDDYAKLHRIKFADIYYKGFNRNGCYCCGFGCHLKGENTFVKLKKWNPTLWKHVMDEWGFREVCEQCGIQIE